MQQLKLIIKLNFIGFLALILAGCDSPLLSHSKEGESNIISPQIAATYFKTENLYVFSRWINGPQLTSNNVVLEFSESESNGTLRDPQEKFYGCLWMGIHGHGSIPVEVEHVSEGTYHLKNFQFIMPGPWELRLYLLDSLPPYEGLCDPEVETEFDPSTIIQLQEIKLEI